MLKNLSLGVKETGVVEGDEMKQDQRCRTRSTLAAGTYQQGNILRIKMTLDRFDLWVSMFLSVDNFT